MEGVYRRTAQLLEIKSIITLLGTEVQTREMVHKNIISGNVSLFARFKKHRKYGKVSSFAGPKLKNDLQVI